MKVSYSGSVSVSTVDWYGRASVVLFFRQCPFRCPYCQNYELLAVSESVDISEAEQDIIKASPFVSSVVFSGGEPMMHIDAVVHLASFAKERGFLVGIETNGFCDDNICTLVGMGLVDRFFIDVKAPPDDPELYGKVAGLDVPGSVDCSPHEIAGRLQRSIECILEAGVQLEMRTTVFRDMIATQDEISSIARWIAEHAGKDVDYVIQQGITENAFSENIRNTLALSRDELLKIGRNARRYLYIVWIRSKEKGNEKI